MVPRMVPPMVPRMVPRMLPPMVPRFPQMLPQMVPQLLQILPRIPPLPFRRPFHRPFRRPLPYHPWFPRGKVEPFPVCHVEVTKPGAQTPINFSEVVQRSRGIPRFLPPSQTRQPPGPEIGPFTHQLAPAAPRRLSRRSPAGIAGGAESA